MQKTGKMKAFITGAGGFIGSNLVDRLTQNNWELKILLKDKSEKVSNKNVQIIYGNITDKNVIEEGVSGADIIFNLAALLPHHKARLEDYTAVNMIGVKNVLDACNRYKIKRLVHISTVGIYGSSGSRIISERSPRKLSDDYSITKAKGEDLVFKYIKDFKLKATIIKPTIAYGPFDKRPGFSTLFKLIHKKAFIPVGNGKNYLHTIYVGNLVDALILAATSQNSIGEDFIIGDDPCPTIGEIVNEIYTVQNLKPPKFYLPKELAIVTSKIFDITEKVGLPSPLSSRRLNFITENRRYNINKAKNILKFKPKISLEEGIRITYRWYSQNGYL